MLTLSVEMEDQGGKAQQHFKKLIPAITPGAGAALDRRIRFIAQDVKLAGAGRSPWLTGSLAHAHAFEATGGSARIYIDPGAVNRVRGGYPAVYGPIVHNRQPWLRETADIDVPRIVEHHLTGLVADMEGL